MEKGTLKLSDFDYQLPKELIAQYPAAQREDSRLLVLDKTCGKINHRSFQDIVDYFSSGDCLILNNTKVIHARIMGRRQRSDSGLGGGKQEIFLLENLAPYTYRVLAKPARKLTVGTKVIFGDGKSSAEVIADQGMKKTVRFSSNGKGRSLWQRLGEVPLPPYIKRIPEDLDETRYQTVFARALGSCASPTAGLHFSQPILKAIENKGVQIVYLTLHINYVTFAPVKTEDIATHKMHREYFILPKESAGIINATTKRGGKIFAVGTTSLRVLETCAKGENNLVSARKGWTDLFIYPPYRFKIANCLLTNFHFPKSTLLMLVSAFAGRELLFKAYQEAIKQRYRFFSYGDAMLIL